MDFLAFTRAVLRDIDDRIELVTEQLLTGTPQSFEQYRATLARRNGLIESREIVIARIGPDERTEFR